MPKPQPRQVFLDHGRVFVEVPLLMTNNELVAVFEDFIAEVHGRLRKAPAQPPEPPKGSPLPPHRYPKKRR
jgi:hypothetical protein